MPTAYPLQDIFENREATGRRGQIGKWAAELASFTLTFVTRTTIKSQAVAEFLAEWTPTKGTPTEPPIDPIWTMYTYGAWGILGAGIVVVITSQSKQKIRYSARLAFQTTNNTTEYEAALFGLQKVKALWSRRALVKSDSQLVTNQVDQSDQVHDPKLSGYLCDIRLN